MTDTHVIATGLAEFCATGPAFLGPHDLEIGPPVVTDTQAVPFAVDIAGIGIFTITVTHEEPQ